jgi:hypothetical protein
VKWTTDKPTKPGWYWAKWKEDGQEFMVWTRKNNLENNRLDVRIYGETYSISDFHSFCGPIQSQKEE